MELKQLARARAWPWLLLLHVMGSVGDSGGQWSAPDGNVVSLGATVGSHDAQKSQMDQPGLFLGSGSRERQGAGPKNWAGWSFWAFLAS